MYFFFFKRCICNFNAVAFDPYAGEMYSIVVVLLFSLFISSLKTFQITNFVCNRTIEFICFPSPSNIQLLALTYDKYIIANINPFGYPRPIL